MVVFLFLLFLLGRLPHCRLEIGKWSRHHRVHYSVLRHRQAAEERHQMEYFLNHVWLGQPDVSPKFE
jgi:hypothetical protein